MTYPFPSRAAWRRRHPSSNRPVFCAHRRHRHFAISWERRVDQFRTEWAPFHSCTESQRAHQARIIAQVCQTAPTFINVAATDKRMVTQPFVSVSRSLFLVDHTRVVSFIMHLEWLERAVVLRQPLRPARYFIHETSYRSMRDSADLLSVAWIFFVPRGDQDYQLTLDLQVVIKPECNREERP